jgi:oligopeptide/dipeptide ABC transporter ATP-binding protein
MNLLEIRDLVVEYRTRGRHVRALDGVSLDIQPGETVGLVGESGSGKTTLGRAILGLVPVSAGSIVFDGADITRAKGARRRALGSQIQAVFQDPYSSLNPALKVSAILAESLHGKPASTIGDMLRRTGLPPEAQGKYPGAFSGGQRQRLAIARALMPSPKLVICDEATSALDLSVQAQILNLLRDLQKQYSHSYLFIGHNLDVVRFVSHRVVVLYHGRVLETGPADAVAAKPRHPYTKLLVTAGRATPPANPKKPALSGCAFAPRCHLATDICLTEKPPLVRANGTTAACHHLCEENS